MRARAHLFELFLRHLVQYFNDNAKRALFGDIDGRGLRVFLLIRLDVSVSLLFLLFLFLCELDLWEDA